MLDYIKIEMLYLSFFSFTTYWVLVVEQHRVNVGSIERFADKKSFISLVEQYHADVGPTLIFYK